MSITTANMNGTIPILTTIHEKDDEAEKCLNGNVIEPETYENLQKIAGNSEIWQTKVLILASFSGFCIALHALIYGFVGIVPDHWCSLPDLTVNHSRAELLKKLTSNLSVDERQCSQHSWTWDNITNSMLIDTSTTVRCRKYEFDQSEVLNTIPSEFQLVCENANLAPYIQVIYMLGGMIGAPLYGIVADRFGRKPVLLVSILISATSGLAISLAPNYTALLILRFLLAMALPGMFDCAYIIVIEIVSEDWRASAGNYFNIPFALGYIFLPVLAYFIRSWRYLQIACSLPSIIFIFAWWHLPESLRWLIRKGRLEEAERILLQGTKGGKVPNKLSHLIRTIYEQERDMETKATFRNTFQDYLTVLRSTRMCCILLTLCLCWFTTAMTYYGLGLNAKNLGADKYTYFFVNGMLEIPGYLAVPVLIKRIGRKPVFIGFMWTCGTALLISTCLREGSVYIVGLSYLGKFVVGANFSLVYLYSSEMLPTLVRSFALGVFSMMGQFGSAIAPFIVDIVGREHKMYPSLIFGSLAMVAGLVSLILPETQNRALPDTSSAYGSKDKQAVIRSLSK